jgi:hypothetical protein
MTLNIQPPPLDPFAPGVRAADVPVTTLSPDVRFSEVAPTPIELPQIAKPRELNDRRLKLRANGYHPVPIVGAHINTKGAGKRPSMPAWQDKCLNAGPEEITGWSRDLPDDTNTGLLCGEIDGVDIDVLDDVLSAKLVARAQELLGPSSLRRIGRAPKVLLAYRVDPYQPPKLLFTSV